MSYADGYDGYGEEEGHSDGYDGYWSYNTDEPDDLPGDYHQDENDYQPFFDHEHSAADDF